MSDAAHPLAQGLARALQHEFTQQRVLLLGIGSGRNVPPFLDAGLRVDAIDDDPGRTRAAVLRFAADPRVRVVRAGYSGPYPLLHRYAGALSTHALLHGTKNDVRAALSAIAHRLAAGSPLYTTLGSSGDPRYGRGFCLAEDCYAAEDGPEAGVPHAYFAAEQIEPLFDGFEIDEVTSVETGDLVGRWAHAGDERIVHWFVRARRRGAKGD